MKFLLLAKDVHEAMQKPPVDHLWRLACLAQLTSFTKTPADYLDQVAMMSASFSPQSATIHGILEDIYDIFSMNFEKANETEGDFKVAAKVREMENADHIATHMDYTEFIDVFDESIQTLKVQAHEVKQAVLHSRKYHPPTSCSQIPR